MQWLNEEFPTRRIAARELGISAKALTTLARNETEFSNTVGWLAHLRHGYEFRNRKKTVQLDTGQKAAMIAELMSGTISKDGACRKYSISTTTLQKYLSDANVRIISQRKPMRREPKIDLAQARALIETGTTITETAKQLGVRHQTVLYHQRQGNLPLTPTQSAKLDVHVPKLGLKQEWDLDMAEKLILAGATLREVGEAVGVSSPTILAEQRRGNLPYTKRQLRKIKRTTDDANVVRPMLKRVRKRVVAGRRLLRH